MSDAGFTLDDVAINALGHLGRAGFFFKLLPLVNAALSPLQL
jgi:hypothetical protein